MASLKKIILKNFATESGKQGITVLQHLLMVPLFINFWGINIYAEWILISVIPTYLLLGSFGLKDPTNEGKKPSSWLTAWPSTAQSIGFLYGLLYDVAVSVEIDAGKLVLDIAMSEI